MSTKRTRIKYEATLNHTALEKLEGQRLNSFLELVKKVILIDGTPFNEATYTNVKNETVHYKLTTGRKNDFLHMINEYATIEFDGIKCQIKTVFDKQDKSKIKDAELRKRINKIMHS